jgi:uncharacterized protein (TIGR00369 family)
MSPAATEHADRTHGVVPREVLTAGTGLDFLHALIRGDHPPPPFSRATGIYMREVAEGRAVFAGTPSADFLNPLGSVHGGWTSAILDSAMACAVHTTLKAGEGYTSVEMKINFVRPVMPDLGELTCEGVVIHRGGTLATSEGKLLDGKGRLLAHGTETCMIMQAKR